MAESTVPVDLLNPGQVFACLGILEATEILLGGAAAMFDWRSEAEVTFCISAAGEVPPMERVTDFLEEAEVVTRVPAGSANFGRWKKSWGEEPEVDDPGLHFPFPDPTKPAKLPVVLRDKAGNEIALEYWGDATRRDDVKFWAGAGGKPGAAILGESIDLVRGRMRQYASQPFALSAPQKISFRFDWRRDYISIQDGFSANSHKSGPTTIVMVGFPLVEVLAAIGMAHARPKRKTKLEYQYAVLGNGEGVLLDPIFHRAALGAKTCPVPGAPFRRFVMHLDWPGREGDARCITHVTEEGD